MQVDFTAEQAEHLSRLARHAGTAPETLVRNAAIRLMEEDTRFRAAVRRGIDQADRGQLIEHDEVVARLERRFAPSE